MDPARNDQLATLRYDFKRLTSRTNITLNAVKLYSSWVYSIKHIYYKNYDFRKLDVNKMCTTMSKCIILHFKGTIMLTHFSGERMAKWQCFGYS